MRKLLFAVLLVMLSPLAAAQVVRDCVTTTCTVRVDDVAAPAVAPTLCRLYNGTVMLTEFPAAPPFACSVTRNYAAGFWNLTMRYATPTQEGPPSNVLAFESRVLVLPTPTNFRFM